MALIVPNATATGSSNKYSSINQAEPDSVDFEALGNTLNYIRSGGGASVGVSPAVTVASGVAVIQGVPYSFATYNYNGASSPTTRFDLLVARLSGSTVSVTLLTGTDSATNPTLPQSKSTLASGVASTSANYDPATDAILATVYTVVSTPLSIASIVDKRIISTAPVTYAVSAVPTSNAKDVIGDTAIFNGASYIKNTASTWAQLTTSTELADAKMPIGAMFAFPSTATVPNATIYLECLGQSLSTTTYASLFAVLGYTYGGSGSSFNLPNVTGDTGLVGATSASISNNAQASTANTSTVVLPQHNHNYTTVIGNKTGKDIVGTKTGYPASARILTGKVDLEQHQHTTALNNTVTERFATIASVSTGSVIVPTTWHGEIPWYFDSNYHNGLVIYFKEDQKLTGNSNNITDAGSTSITIPTNLAISTDIGTVTITTDIGSPEGTTDNTGTSGASMNILSKSVRVRWFIRFA